MAIEYFAVDLFELEMAFEYFAVDLFELAIASEPFVAALPTAVVVGVTFDVVAELTSAVVRRLDLPYFFDASIEQLVGTALLCYYLAAQNFAVAAATPVGVVVSEAIDALCLIVVAVADYSKGTVF